MAEAEVEFVTGNKWDISIDVTNHRGERMTRTVRPVDVRFCSTQYHPEEQWMLYAYDYTREDFRTFAMKDIHSWRPA